MAKLAILLLASVVALTMLADEVNAACCSCKGKWILYGWRCGDWTTCTPCCGKGRCNIFCCNCDGGCRGQNRRKSSVEPNGFQEIDLDGDGFVNREELISYLKSGSCGNYSEKIASFDQSFKSLDKNGDGKLTFDEIDSAV